MLIDVQMNNGTVQTIESSNVARIARYGDIELHAPEDQRENAVIYFVGDNVGYIIPQTREQLKLRLQQGR